MLIDDNVFTLRSVGKALEMNGYPTMRYRNPDLALKDYDPERFAVVVTDYRMPTMTGLDVVHHIRSLSSEAAVILYSGVMSNDLMQEASRLNTPYYEKPFDIESLLTDIERYYQ
jgi:DNA-binding NtrC family response regulator